MPVIAKQHSRKKAGKLRRAPEGPDVRTMRARYRISQVLLSRLLDVSLRTISSLESSGKRASFQRNLAQIARLCHALAAVMDESFVGQWLDTPNEMLNGLKPVEAIERGQIDLVWQIVEGLRSGTQL